MENYRTGANDTGAGSAGQKVFVQTWGCQMNVADSERMLALLGQKNYSAAATADDADVIILNTCHIRENARHKVVSRLGELRKLKSEKPHLVLAVAGCVAQAEAKKLTKEVPFLDLIFGPDQIEKVPELIDSVRERDAQEPIPSGFQLTRPPIVEAKFNKEKYSIPMEKANPWIPASSNEVSRFVNIIKGCNNFCTFCVVPYTRGREKSRTVEEILNETRFLASQGAKEIVLLGQNVNSYGLDFLEKQPTNAELQNINLPFVELLEKVSEVSGVQRIRFMTSNPHDFTPQLADAYAKLSKVTSSFHLPVQSGSNRVLERMNRQYNIEEYLERVSWIRKARPDVSFSSDIIVGFPGETDEDFNATLSLVQKMQYSFIYGYCYSKRDGTPAARFTDTVPEEISSARLNKLLALQDQITTAQNLAEIGSEREALVLYRDKKLENSWYGRTFQGRLVRIHSARNIEGATIPVKITDANKTALLGIPI